MKKIVTWLAAALCAGMVTGAPLGAAQSQETAQSGASQTHLAIAEGLQVIDGDRLDRDPAYAESILPELVRLRTLSEPFPELSLVIDALHGYALAVADRGEEAKRAIDRYLDRRPDRSDDYPLIFQAALRVRDPVRAARVIEVASRELPAGQWAGLRSMVSSELGGILFRALNEAGAREQQVPLADALYRIGWPRHDDHDWHDSLRKILLDDQLRRGDREAATGLAGSFATPRAVLPLILLRRYDGLLPAGEAGVAHLRSVLEAHDRETAEALAAAPQDIERIMSRVDVLRGLGRDADALALLLPLTRDVPATLAAHRQGRWAINEATSILRKLDREDEAISLMRQLADQDISRNSDVISFRINHATLLWVTERRQQAIEYVGQIGGDLARHASDYGRMWAWSVAACSAFELGRTADGEGWRARMRDKSGSNRAAMVRAHLCAGDMAAAEAEMIRRLEDDEPIGAVLALQAYSLPDTEAQTPLEQRFAELRQRPALRAVLERVAHRVTLPLREAYWVIM